MRGDTQFGTTTVGLREGGREESSRRRQDGPWEFGGDTGVTQERRLLGTIGDDARGHEVSLGYR